MFDPHSLPVMLLQAKFSLPKVTFANEVSTGRTFFVPVTSTNVWLKCQQNIIFITMLKCRKAIAFHLQQEWRSVEHIPPPPTFIFDIPKFNHLVPCGQGYDWQSLVTIGLELAPGSCSQAYLYIPIHIPTYYYENISSHHLQWGR